MYPMPSILRKHLKLYISITSILLASLLPQGCATKKKPSSTYLGRSFTKDKSHLRHYGYYASAQSWDGKGDYIIDLNDFGNTFWVGGANIEEKLRKISDLGKMAFVNIQFELFDQNNRLKKDWRAHWNSFHPKIAPYTKTIASIYICDECLQDNPKTGVTFKQMHEDLRQISKEIRVSFPTIPQSTVLSPDGFLSDEPLVEEIDWYGFDFYYCYEICHYKGHTFSIPQVLTRLKAQLKREHKYILVPGSSLQWEMGTSLQAQRTQVEYLEKYMVLALNDPDVVGVFPFVYFDSHNNRHGAESLPLIHQTVGKIYQKLISEKSIPPSF